jgi:hypothetical protein
MSASRNTKKSPPLFLAAIFLCRLRSGPTESIFTGKLLQILTVLSVEKLSAMITSILFLVMFNECNNLAMLDSSFFVGMITEILFMA